MARNTKSFAPPPRGCVVASLFFFLCLRRKIALRCAFANLCLQNYGFNKPTFLFFPENFLERKLLEGGGRRTRRNKKKQEEEEEEEEEDTLFVAKNGRSSRSRDSGQLWESQRGSKCGAIPASHEACCFRRRWFCRLVMELALSNEPALSYCATLPFPWSSGDSTFFLPSLLQQLWSSKLRLVGDIVVDGRFNLNQSCK